MNQQLQAILAQKQIEIAALPPTPRSSTGEEAIKEDCGTFEQALRQPGVSIIAEVKRRSPSAGSLLDEIDADLLAQRYAANGAAAISCLTDQKFFGAQGSDLADVRRAVNIPVLRKDFIIDERQIGHSAVLQADAILLIVRILSPQRLASLHQYATDCGLDVLVETHDAEEIATAIDAGARIIGVNNRDLDDFSTDFERCLRLRDRIPSDCIAVAESAIDTACDIERLNQAGFDAALIGTALVTATDVEETLQGFVAAGSKKDSEIQADDKMQREVVL